jgi:hypothetical protein
MRLAWASRLLLAGAAAVWATALPAPFDFDDLADVARNPAAQAATFLERLGQTVRPLLKASYALQDWLHGPWAPGFHAGNVLLHLGAGLAALALLRRLCRQAGLGEAVAWTAVALWSLHPALTASVTQVAGRSAVLSGLLLLGALALAAGPPTRARLLGAAGLAFLAPLARETALVLPPLLLWWQLTLGRAEGAAWRRALPVWAGTLLAAGVILALPRHRELVEFSLQARAPLEALRGNAVAIPAMLRFLALPWELSIDPAQPRPWGWGSWQVLAALAALLGSGLAALLLRRRAPLAAFALGWTLLCLLPSNSILWRDEPVGLRPLYLAALGPALLLALALARQAAGRALAIALVLALGVQTVGRNLLHATPLDLWREAAAKAPDKARPHIRVGLLLLELGCLPEAEAALLTGLRLEPGSRAARQGLERLALHEGGRPSECELLD